MVIKNIPKKSQLWRFKWHIVFVFLAIAALILFTTGSLFDNSLLSAAARFLFYVILITVFFAVLISLRELIRSSQEIADKLDNTSEMLIRNLNLLQKVSQAVRLSDDAKEIAFRDIGRMELVEAVLGKLHQHDFDSTDAMIEGMEQSVKFKDLGQQLRKKVDRYRSATEVGRLNQVIAHIEQLLDQHHWGQAAVQIDNLLKAFPDFKEARAMPRKLRERKDMRKRELLAMWDKAVKAKDTDRSLEILKELDQYLTPNEGLALQESASSVFRTKLHNLGVQFALAVTEKQWDVALESGKQIMRDFPNSRMAQEIRGKIDILQDKVRPSNRIVDINTSNKSSQQNHQTVE